MRRPTNKYLFRGVVRLVMAAVLLLVSYLYHTQFPVVINGAVLLAVFVFSRGLYYVIPFSPNSPWNGEMRFYHTAFELYAFVFAAAILGVVSSGFKMRSVVASIGMLVVMGFLFYYLGKLAPQRRHGPVGTNTLDKLLERLGIF